MSTIKEELSNFLLTGNDFVNEFSSLTAQQLNWKPDAQSWSIAQCLDHIIKSNKTYFPGFERLHSKDYKLTFWEKINPLTATTGRQMIESLGVEVKKKYKSPLIFSPAKSNIQASIVADFATHQEELIKIISKLSSEQFEKGIMTSPVAKLISLNVKDVVRILLVHERRHLQQALRVKTHEGFPK